MAKQNKKISAPKVQRLSGLRLVKHLQEQARKKSLEQLNSHMRTLRGAELDLFVQAQTARRAAAARNALVSRLAARDAQNPARGSQNASA